MTDYEVTSPPTRLANRIQFRTAFTTERVEVARFMVQLQYWHDGEWWEIVRYDHDCDAESGHDITTEGLHCDVCCDGEKIRTEQVSAPIPADQGFDYVEDGLVQNTEEYIKRFETWHEIRNGDKPVSEEEYAEMNERIRSHFERVRVMLAEARNDE